MNTKIKNNVVEPVVIGENILNGQSVLPPAVQEPEKECGPIHARQILEEKVYNNKLRFATWIISQGIKLKK